MQEVCFDQVNRPKEDWNRRSLCSTEDMVNVCLVFDFIPEPGGGFLANKSVTVGSTSDFEWCPV